MAPSIGRIGVYKITHVESERCYVGSSANIDRRWGDHVRDFRGGRHHSPYFERCWNKYGQDAFTFETLEECDLDVLIEREQMWIDKLNPVFNSAPAAGSPLGFKHSAETRAQRSQALMGNTNSLGFKHTAETRAKVSEALTGRVRSPESRAKTSASLKNNPKLVASHVGLHHSEETKAKMSASAKAFHARKRLEQPQEGMNENPRTD